MVSERRCGENACGRLLRNRTHLWIEANVAREFMLNRIEALIRGDCPRCSKEVVRAKERLHLRAEHKRDRSVSTRGGDWKAGRRRRDYTAIRCINTYLKHLLHRKNSYVK
jgi:hypothetical protein